MKKKENKNSANTKSGEKLCLACGLCCDGTLFKGAVIEKNEGLKIHSQLDLTVDKEKNRFMLPCHLHDPEVGCTVYGQVRPRVCGNFRCKLLKRLHKGKVSEQEALKIVVKTKALKKQVVSEIIKRASFIEPLTLIEKFILVFKSSHEDPYFRRTNAKLFIAYVALRKMLEKHFYKTESKEIIEDEDSSEMS